MPNLVDLDNLDDEAVSRIRSAAARHDAAKRSKAKRKAQTAAATKASAASRARDREAGIRRKSPNMTKAQRRQRGLNATATRKARDPERFTPKPCCIPGCAKRALVHGQCKAHDTAWRRSTLPLADWFADREVPKAVAKKHVAA